MERITVQELSLEAFKAYGQYDSVVQPQGVSFDSEEFRFYRDLQVLRLGTSSNVSFSVCQVNPRPFVIDTVECHNTCGEGILPLDGDVLIHVAPASSLDEIPLSQVEVFRIPRGTLVSLNPGVWHHAPFTLNEHPVNVLISLPERTYVNDCIVRRIPNNKQIAVEV